MAKRDLDKFRVGFDARGAIWYRGTGIGTYTFQLAAGLAEELGERVEFMRPGAEYDDLAFTMTDFLPLETTADYYAAEFLPHWLEQRGIDLYHVPQNGIGMPSYSRRARLKSRCKLIATIHDLIPYIYPETVGRGYLKEFLAAMPDVMRRADGIITVSEQSKADIRRIFDYPAERIRVIHEAAEPFYCLQRRSECRELLRAHYGIDRPFVLYVGGFGERKNLRGLLVAFTLAVKELPPEQRPLLVCPGRAERAGQRLIELAELLGVGELLRLPGYVPTLTMPRFYGAAELFVYPSLYEGFGLPILEAMACGCPVVAADNSSLPEVAGEAAILTDGRDTTALAAAILHVLTDPELRTEMAERSLARAAEFSWQRNVRQTLSFYRRVLRGRAGASGDRDAPHRLTKNRK